MKKSLIVSLAIALIASGFNSVSQIQAKDILYPAKEFKLPEIYKNRSLPPKVDNRNKYLREVLEHLGGSCGFASSIGYTFTYEINAVRDLEANSDDTHYPYVYAYHWYNDGSSSKQVYDFIYGYQIAMATGIPNTTVMGGFTEGYPTKWLNGYEKYYEAMKNRVVEYNYFDCTKSEGIDNLKQWLFDHANGDAVGGVVNFSIDCCQGGGTQTTKVSSGPESGKTLITSFGTQRPDHALTVVGYNDEVTYDFNNDGRITSDIDINRDGEVDLSDREDGAFLILNSHIKWDDGFAYCPYSLFSASMSQGGITHDNKAYCIKVAENYEPRYVLKATVTHSVRENIKIFAGIAEGPDATQPTITKEFAGAFNYAGGDYPMEGKNMESIIEIGLDVSDLIDSIDGDIGTFFLCVDSKSGGSGKVNKLSLMDYTGDTPREIPYDEEDVTISGDIVLGGITNPTGIKNINNSFGNSGFLITPNPVIRGGNISLVLPDIDFLNAQIQFFNLNGKMVLQKKVKHSQALSTDLTTASLAPGIYKVLLTVRKRENSQKRYSAMICIFD